MTANYGRGTRQQHRQGIYKLAVDTRRREGDEIFGK